MENYAYNINKLANCMVGSEFSYAWLAERRERNGIPIEEEPYVAPPNPRYEEIRPPFIRNSAQGDGCYEFVIGAVAWALGFIALLGISKLALVVSNARESAHFLGEYSVTQRTWFVSAIMALAIVFVQVLDSHYARRIKLEAAQKRQLRERFWLLSYPILYCGWINCWLFANRQGEFSLKIVLSILVGWFGTAVILVLPGSLRFISARIAPFLYQLSYYR